MEASSSSGEVPGRLTQRERATIRWLAERYDFLRVATRAMRLRVARDLFVLVFGLLAHNLRLPPAS